MFKWERRLNAKQREALSVSTGDIPEIVPDSNLPVLDNEDGHDDDDHKDMVVVVVVVMTTMVVMMASRKWLQNPFLE